MRTCSRSSVVPLAVVSVLMLAAAAVGCSEDGGGREGGREARVEKEVDRYQAEIRRTSYGIPHITADDWGSLGFGQGYAFAQAHLCTLADQVLKVRSERSEFFGAGEDDANLSSDLAYLALGLRDAGRQDVEEQPDDIVDIVTGYAAGYNAYLAETGVAAIPDWCAGAAWVRPIDAADLFAYYRDLALYASGGRLLPYIAGAQPPAATQDTTTSPPLGPASLPFDADRSAATVGPPPDLGSNGWAIGAERTESGGGMVLANPHFPWTGERRLWESQLTIPGELDVYGVSLLGTPGIQIGFNRDVAWTHTVSDGKRFTLYSLSLVPGRPTTYRYGDSEVAMVPTEHRVKVKQADGRTDEVTRTLWSSRYGPMVVLPSLGWNATTAYTYRDANIDNDELLAQFLGMDRATDLNSFRSVFRDIGGIPWVNTMVADAKGQTWYIDGAATPNLSREAVETWEQQRIDDPVTRQLYEDFGVILLDGSDPANEWQEVDGARDPGLLPYERQPKLSRPDFVANANDSHWIANPGRRLEGYSPLTGEERTPLSLRTRQNFLTLTATGAGSASGPDGLFTIDELTSTVMANESLTAELLRTPVAERCRAAAEAGPVLVEGTAIDLAPACAALEGWDGRFDLESRGAVLWREFAAGYLTGNDAAWAVPADPLDPLNTPRGLPVAPPTGPDPVIEALAEAVRTLGLAALPLDGPLGEAQYTLRGDRRIPIHGGRGIDGVLNVVTTGGDTAGATLAPQPKGGEPIGAPTERTGITDTGYLVVNGSSFVLAVELTDGGPEASALLTYSQSSDASSPNFDDQTRLFSQKQWREVRFSKGEINADPNLETFTVHGN